MAGAVQIVAAGASQRDELDLSVIVPLYREAGRIRPTLEDLVATLAAGDRTSELILVNDGSDDDSVEVVKPFVSEYRRGSLRRVRLLSHPENRGKGAAVRTGLAAAVGKWRLMMDADNSCRVGEVEKLLKRALVTGASFIAGSRRVRGAEVEARPDRKLMGALFRIPLKVLGLAVIEDTQCGFKLYRSDLARLIVARAVEDGFSFDLEHLLLAGRNGFKIEEVGVVWKHAEGGTVQPMRDGVRMIGRAAAIRFRAMRPRTRGSVGAGVEVKPGVSPAVEVKPRAIPKARIAAMEYERERARALAGKQSETGG